ncbi:MAG: DNA primase [Phycisphaerales bacterium]
MTDRDRVLDATDIVDVVGDHVPLRQKGREFVCLCPFHDDRNPSMYVVPTKQIFHCFVCGAGGNAIDFVMKYHGMGFIEALRHLAERSGVSLEPPRRSGGREGEGAREVEVGRDDLAKASRTAFEFFRSILRHESHGAAARAVVERRGISDEMVESFGIGAAPDRWDGLVQLIRARNLPMAPFEAAGLLRAKEDRRYDTFRNRLVFPIFDQIGRPVAFGGRIIDPEDTPKYLNSPESPLFDKSSTLFGLRQAMNAVKSSRTVIVTEGYTDVIACHQAGIDNVVATLGTALTERHARLLRRLCDRVILLFDGDEAGQRAADRAFEVFFLEPVDVCVAVLPDGRDPDELLHEPDGPDRFRAAIDESRDAIAFRMERLASEIRTRGGEVDSAARVRLVESELERLTELGFHDLNPIRRQALVRRLGRVSGLGEQAVMGSIPGPRRRGNSAARSSVESKSISGSIAPGGPVLDVAGHVLGCLLNRPELAVECGDGIEELLDRCAYDSRLASSVTRVMKSLRAEGRVMDFATVMSVVEDGEVREYATGVALQVAAITDEDPDRLKRHWDGCLGRLSRVGEEMRSTEESASLVERLARAQEAHRRKGTANAPVLPRPM